MLKTQDRKVVYKGNQLTSSSLTAWCSDVRRFQIVLVRAQRKDLQNTLKKQFFGGIPRDDSVDGLLPLEGALIPLVFGDSAQAYFMSAGVCKDLLSVFTIVDMLNPGFWSSSNLRSYFPLSFCSRFVLAAISSSICCVTFSCLLSFFKQPPHSPSVCIKNYFWS